MSAFKSRPAIVLINKESKAPAVYKARFETANRSNLDHEINNMISAFGSVNKILTFECASSNESY